jgi:hypothetical protein
MELEFQETKYKSKKKEVDRLSKLLEEVIEFSNSGGGVSKEQILKQVQIYEEQITEKS